MTYNNKKRIINSGKKTLRIESSAVSNLINKLGDNFVKAVNLILSCKGRVVVTGIGKSGVIGRKITSTLASTGTPSMFIHSAEGSHGDLGMIVSRDVVLAISYSGETDEISNLLPVFKRIGVKVISITGNPGSTLAKYSDIVLNIHVNKEACPLGLAPTASTTAALALGDAIAVALINEKGFTSQDFALYHPSGSLGKNLLITVGDLMKTGKDLPLVGRKTILKKAIVEMTTKMLGTTGVIDSNGKFIGIFTDGDLRRIIEKNINFTDIPIEKVMTKRPVTIDSKKLAAEALLIMNKKKITCLFVLDKKRKPEGIIHMHQILQAGIN